VRHEHAALAQAALQLPEGPPQRNAEGLVQRREGFVQQQQRGPRRQRAGQGHALALTARELAGPLPGMAGQADEGQQLVDAGLLLRGRLAARLQAEADVLPHAEVGEKRVVLEHDADAALLRGHGADVAAVELDATAAQGLQAGDGAQQRRLAAARAAQQGQHLAAGQVQVDALQDGSPAQGHAGLAD